MTLQLLQLLGIHKVIIGHADHHSKRIFEFGAIQTNRQEREVVHQDKAEAAAPPGAQTTQMALTWWKSSFSCRSVCMTPILQNSFCIMFCYGNEHFLLRIQATLAGGIKPPYYICLCGKYHIVYLTLWVCKMYLCSL